MKQKYDESDFLTICALRFDGYKYREKLKQPVDTADLIRLSENLVKTREFHDNRIDNLATFFFLQRFLYKWGGEYLTEFSDEHVAFRLLFLHLYREEIPPEFQMEEFCDIWRKKYEPVRELLAAQIRRHFRRA